MAAEHGDHFMVLLVSYHKHEQRCVGASEYRDVLRLFANGAMQSVTECFDFEVQEVEDVSVE